MPRILSETDVDDFRSQLVDIATKRFAEHGYAGVTLRGLADEIGCSRMTPYRYFHDKADIFAAVRAAAFRELGDSLEAAEKRARNPREGLEAVGKAYLRFASRKPDAYRLLFELAPALGKGATRTELEKELSRHADSMTRATEAAIEAGLLHGDARTLAHLFWAGMHGVVALQLSGKLTHGRSFSQLSKEMVRTLFRGMAPPSGSERTREKTAGRKKGKRNR